MLKKALTFATAMVALGGAVAGNANAKNLLQEAGWWHTQEGMPDTFVGDNEPTDCPGGSNITCAYFTDENGDVVDNLTKFRAPGN